VARFLAVESCGQCTPCKLDGLEISDRLAKVCAGTATPTDLAAIERRLGTVVNGARCNLAQQQQTVVGSLMERFGDEVRAHLQPGTDPVVPAVVVDLSTSTSRAGRRRRATATSSPTDLRRT
jgi:NADH:ubiquinone oxidoreductase subunit F (NADH-binding)